MKIKRNRVEILKIVEKNGVVFAECEPAEKLISSEQDAVDLIGLCGYHQTNNLLLYAKNIDANSLISNRPLQEEYCKNVLITIWELLNGFALRY